MAIEFGPRLQTEFHRSSAHIVAGSILRTEDSVARRQLNVSADDPATEHAGELRRVKLHVLEAKRVTNSRRTSPTFFSGAMRDIFCFDNASTASVHHRSFNET